MGDAAISLPTWAEMKSASLVSSEKMIPPCEASALSGGAMRTLYSVGANPGEQASRGGINERSTLPRRPLLGTVPASWLCAVGLRLRGTLEAALFPTRSRGAIRSPAGGSFIRRPLGVDNSFILSPRCLQERHIGIGSGSQFGKQERVRNAPSPAFCRPLG